jgi:hypothetical protein
VIILEIDGRKVETDPELINVVPLDGAPEFLMARRAHADNCERYVIEAEKRKFRDEERAKLKKAAFAGGVGKRPTNGRREPGQ